MLAPTNMGEISTARPASVCASRLPPSSRAISAATTMTAAPASTVSNRSAGSELGMPARGQIVELVSVPAVAIGDRHRYAHLGGDQQQQGHPGRACFDGAKLAQ